MPEGLKKAKFIDVKTQYGEGLPPVKTEIRPAPELKEVLDFSVESAGETRSKTGDEETNEDAVEFEGNMSCVCDGLGSTVGAREASHIAAEAFKKYLKENKLLAAKGLPRQKTNVMVLHMQEALMAANNALRTRKQEEAKKGNPDISNAETTLAGSVFFQDGDRVKIAIANAGDSNIYRLRGGKFEKLTSEHSSFGDFARLGMDISIEHVCREEIRKNDRAGVAACSQKTIKEVVDSTYPEQMKKIIQRFEEIRKRFAGMDIKAIEAKLPELPAEERAIYNAAFMYQNVGTVTLSRLRNVLGTDIKGADKVDQVALDDVRVYDVEDGDLYVNVSDGATDSVPESAFGQELSQHAKEPVQKQAEASVNYGRLMQKVSPIKNKPDDTSVVIMKAEITERLAVEEGEELEDLTVEAEEVAV